MFMYTAVNGRVVSSTVLVHYTAISYKICGAFISFFISRKRD
jgi:hypothetical protein